MSTQPVVIDGAGPPTPSSMTAAADHIDWERLYTETSRCMVWRTRTHALFDAQFTRVMVRVGTKGESRRTSQTAVVHRHVTETAPRDDGQIYENTERLVFSPSLWLAIMRDLVTRGHWRRDVVSLSKQLPSALTRALILCCKRNIKWYFPSAVDADAQQNARLLYTVFNPLDYFAIALTRTAALQQMQRHENIVSLDVVSSSSSAATYTQQKRPRTDSDGDDGDDGDDDSSDSDDGAEMSQSLLHHCTTAVAVTEHRLVNMTLIMYAETCTTATTTSPMASYMRAVYYLNTWRLHKAPPPADADRKCPAARRAYAMLLENDKYWRDDAERAAYVALLDALEPYDVRSTLNKHHVLHSRRSRRLSGAVIQIDAIVPLMDVIHRAAAQRWNLPTLKDIDVNAMVALKIKRCVLTALDIEATSHYLSCDTMQRDIKLTDTRKVLRLMYADATHYYCAMVYNDLVQVQVTLVPRLCTYPERFVRLRPASMVGVHIDNFASKQDARVRSAIASLLHMMVRQNSLPNVMNVDYMARVHRVLHRVFRYHYAQSTLAEMLDDVWDPHAAHCKRYIWETLTSPFMHDDRVLSISAASRGATPMLHGGSRSLYTSLITFLNPTILSSMYSHDIRDVVNNVILNTLHGGTAVQLRYPFGCGVLLLASTQITVDTEVGTVVDLKNTVIDALQQRGIVWNRKRPDQLKSLVENTLLETEDTTPEQTHAVLHALYNNIPLSVGICEMLIDNDAPQITDRVVNQIFMSLSPVHAACPTANDPLGARDGFIRLTSPPPNAYRIAFESQAEPMQRWTEEARARLTPEQSVAEEALFDYVALETLQSFFECVELMSYYQIFDSRRKLIPEIVASPPPPSPSVVITPGGPRRIHRHGAKRSLKEPLPPSVRVARQQLTRGLMNQRAPPFVVATPLTADENRRMKTLDKPVMFNDDNSAVPLSMTLPVVRAPYTGFGQQFVGDAGGGDASAGRRRTDFVYDTRRCVMAPFYNSDPDLVYALLYAPISSVVAQKIDEKM